MSQQSYKEYRQELKAAQQGLSREEVLNRLRNERDEHDPHKPKYVDIFDPDSYPDQNHRWVDRGVVVSCEGGGHPNHRVFKRR